MITDQLSRSLDVKVGDEVVLKNSDDKERKVKISGITENYLFKLCIPFS